MVGNIHAEEVYFVVSNALDCAVLGDIMHTGKSEWREIQLYLQIAWGGSVAVAVGVSDMWQVTGQVIPDATEDYKFQM